MLIAEKSTKNQIITNVLRMKLKNILISSNCVLELKMHERERERGNQSFKH